jgi:hypothetical protein
MALLPAVAQGGRRSILARPQSIYKDVRSQNRQYITGISCIPSFDDFK